MALICDDCGREACLEGLPDDIEWLEWLQDMKRGENAMLVMADCDGVHALCRACFDAMVAEARQELTPNAEVRGD